jgi:hypothetical protein
LSLFYCRQNICQVNRQFFRRTSWWSRYVPFCVWCFMEFRYPIFKDQEAVKCLSSLHDKYVIVPADKASNNIVFVCKSYYFECLIKELGINNNTSSNTTYKPTCWKIKSFDGGYLRERSWFKVIQKIFRIFQNPHVIYATMRVNSFTIIDTIQRKVHSGIINLFDERIVYSPDKDSVCSKRGTTEILWNCLLA